MPSITPHPLNRRLIFVEGILLAAGLALFYAVTDFKEIGYAVGVLLGIGICAAAFFSPRLGLIGILVILFTESTVNTINVLAGVAVDNNLSGVPPLVNTQWFAFGVLILFVVILLSYACREYLEGRKLRPLSALEWALLAPLIMQDIQAYRQGGRLTAEEIGRLDPETLARVVDQALPLYLSRHDLTKYLIHDNGQYRIVATLRQGQILVNNQPWRVRPAQFP